MQPSFASVFFSVVFHSFPDHPDDFVLVLVDLGCGNAPFFCDFCQGYFFFSAGVFDDEGFIYVCQAAGQAGCYFTQAEDVFRRVFAKGVAEGDTEAFNAICLGVVFLVPVPFDAGAVALRHEVVCQPLDVGFRRNVSVFLLEVFDDLFFSFCPLFLFLRGQRDPAVFPVAVDFMVDRLVVVREEGHVCDDFSAQGIRITELHSAGGGRVAVVCHEPESDPVFVLFQGVPCFAAGDSSHCVLLSRRWGEMGMDAAA